jgi:hypothetical protein
MPLGVIERCGMARLGTVRPVALAQCKVRTEKRSQKTQTEFNISVGDYRCHRLIKNGPISPRSNGACVELHSARKLSGLQIVIS